MDGHCWHAAQSRLRDEISPAAFENWLLPLQPVGPGIDPLVLAAPSEFHRQWVRSQYLGQILSSCSAADPSVRRVEIVVKEDGTAAPGEAPPSAAPSHVGSVLDPQRTFDSFVVGASNQVAYAAARRVAEGRTSGNRNLLFFSGGVGLGKTHLMHAIAWEIVGRGKRNVAYLSSEKFTSEFVAALRAKDTDAFKRRFRTVDVFMVDDVQFLASRVQTQEEFFHTFDALSNEGKQIVVSGDRAPVDMEDVDRRLRSRLGGGLLAELRSTTYELRLSILQRHRSRYDEVSVPDAALEFLATKITNDIRELTGALARVVAHAEYEKRPVTLDLVRDALPDLLRANQRRVTVEAIQKAVTEYYGLRRGDLVSARRERRIVGPRQVAMWLCKQLTPMSLPDIGGRFNRDHSTVVHSTRRVDERLANEPVLVEDVEKLKHWILD